MILSITYMIVGILIGVLIKLEADNINRRKRLNNRMRYMQSNAVQDELRKYDSMLESIRTINSSLSEIQNQNKKEVR